MKSCTRMSLAMILFTQKQAERGQLLGIHLSRCQKKWAKRSQFQQVFWELWDKELSECRENVLHSPYSVNTYISSRNQKI